MRDARATLIVHGGLETPDSASTRRVLESAARTGGDALVRGRLEAVEAAIRALEESADFNAGYGAVLNRIGEVELDALIVDGPSGRAGAVAAIQGVKHPISVARIVLEASSSVLIAGAGAARFAQEQGVPVESCETAAQREAWERAIALGNAERAGLHPFTGRATQTHASDTVGAIALTGDGTAAAVSTGGLFLKTPGRVGDSAIPGAGAWASPAGAVAGTGLGEAFIELQLARRVAARLETGVHPQEAVEEALSNLFRRYGAVGGLIAVDADGRVGAAHSGSCMIVAEFRANFGLTPIAPTRLKLQGHPSS